MTSHKNVSQCASFPPSFNIIKVNTYHTSRKFNDYFRLSPMWEEPQYTPSACEDDLLADIGRYKPGLARPSALTPLSLASLAERDEWYEIGLLGDAPRKILEGEWTPMAAWLAHCDMYTRLWEPVNTDSHKAIDAVCNELEKRNYEWEEKEKGGGESCPPTIETNIYVDLYRFSNPSSYREIEPISCRPVAYGEQH